MVQISIKNYKNQDDVNGHHILLLFDTAVELENNMRLDQNDRHAVGFYEFLQGICDRTNTEADWNILHQKCSRYAKVINAWKNEEFDSQEFLYLYCKNVDVQKHNNECITKLQKPITYIQDTNTGICRKSKAETALGLDVSMYFYSGSCVLFITNVCQPSGL